MKRQLKFKRTIVNFELPFSNIAISWHNQNFWLTRLILLILHHSLLKIWLHWKSNTC